MSGPRALTRYDTSLKAPRLSSKSPESLVQRRVQRYLVEASPARREAEAELLRTPQTFHALRNG
jgi:hypothetical protein